MSEYTPDRWVIVKIVTKNKGTFYKVFGSWFGGYLSGDSWRLNSGITGGRSDGKMFKFLGSSGSEYNCHKEFYGTTGVTRADLAAMEKDAAFRGIDMKVLTEKEAFSLEWLKEV